MNILNSSKYSNDGNQIHPSLQHSLFLPHPGTPTDRVAYVSALFSSPFIVYFGQTSTGVQYRSTVVQEYSAVYSAVLFQKVKVKHDDKRVQLDSLSIGTGPRIQVRTGYDSAL